MLCYQTRSLVLRSLLDDLSAAVNRARHVDPPHHIATELEKSGFSLASQGKEEHALCLSNTME